MGDWEFAQLCIWAFGHLGIWAVGHLGSGAGYNKVLFGHDCGSLWGGTGGHIDKSAYSICRSKIGHSIEKQHGGSIHSKSH